MTLAGWDQKPPKPCRWGGQSGRHSLTSKSICLEGRIGSFCGNKLAVHHCSSRFRGNRVSRNLGLNWESESDSISPHIQHRTNVHQSPFMGVAHQYLQRAYTDSIDNKKSVCIFLYIYLSIYIKVNLSPDRLIGWTWQRAVWTQGHFTHKPKAMTMKLWEPKRKVPKGCPTPPPKSCSVVTYPQV